MPLVVKPRAAAPLNVTVYRSEGQQLIQWSGTLGDTWELRYSGRVLLP